MYTFPSKQLELLQNNYWSLNIHSVQNHLSESLWFAFSYRSACIYEENTSKYWWRFFLILQVFGTCQAQIYLYVRIITALIIIIPRTLWSPENEKEGPSFVPALKTVSFSFIPIEEIFLLFLRLIFPYRPLSIVQLKIFFLNRKAFWIFLPEHHAYSTRWINITNTKSAIQQCSNLANTNTAI